MSDTVKRQIAEDILSFKPQVKINHPRATAMFEQTLREQPELLAYISGYSFSAPLMLSSYAFNMRYCNTDVPRSCLFRVNTPAEAEAVLHRAVSGFFSSVIIIAPCGIDVAAVYSGFNVAYDGFYSNLVGTEYSAWSMSKFDCDLYRFNFKFRIGKVKLIMMERDVDREVDRLTRLLFTPDMRAETKAYIAHNYLARNVEYWLKEDATPLEMSYRQSAYGALINKKCVCQGYAEAYKRLLDSQGIENYVLCGKVKGSAVHHAWNAVSFNGKDFYHVDVTWDSQGGGLSSHRYFCKTDEDMRPTRIWTRRPGVVCTSTVNVASVAKEDLFYNKEKYMAHGVDKRNF